MNKSSPYAKNPAPVATIKIAYVPIMGPTNSRFFTILLAQNGFTDEQFLEGSWQLPDVGQARGSIASGNVLRERQIVNRILYTKMRIYTYLYTI